MTDLEKKEYESRIDFEQEKFWSLHIKDTSLLNLVDKIGSKEPVIIPALEYYQ